ncbi:MAG: chromate transporter [Clostridia bacterium]|nr:chromate transporter [Clostridia bacterium]
MQKNKPQLFKLFLSTFTLSAFTFGGGYVIISLMKKKFVDDLKWLEESEMLDMTALAQASPGPVAVNASILLGYRVAGIAGALVSIAGTVLPPLIIISVISFFYTAFRQNAVVQAVFKGMRAGVAAVIADVVCSLGTNVVRTKDAVSILVMIAAFTATYVFEVNVVYIILVCAVLGAARAVLGMHRKGGDDK